MLLVKRRVVLRTARTQLDGYIMGIFGKIPRDFPRELALILHIKRAQAEVPLLSSKKDPKIPIVIRYIADYSFRGIVARIYAPLLSEASASGGVTAPKVTQD